MTKPQDWRRRFVKEGGVDRGIPQAKWSLVAEKGAPRQRSFTRTGDKGRALFETGARAYLVAMGMVAGHEIGPGTVSGKWGTVGVYCDGKKVSEATLRLLSLRHQKMKGDRRSAEKKRIAKLDRELAAMK